MYLVYTGADSDYPYWFFSLEKASNTSGKTVKKALKGLKRAHFKPDNFTISDNIIYKDAGKTPYATILCKIPDNIKRGKYMKYLKKHHPELLI